MTSSNILVYGAKSGFAAIDHVTRETLAEGGASDVLAHAVAALPPEGGLVQLLAGVYPLERSLELRSRITLRGSGRATRILAPPRSSGPAAIAGWKCDGTEVADLAVVGTMQSAPIGLLLDSCGDCRASGVFAKGFPEHGLSLRNGSFLCRIEHCVAAACERANFHFYELAKDGRGGDYVPNLAIGCVAYGGQVGFETDWCLVLNLVACVVHQSRSHGFHLHRHSNSVLLSGCRTYQVGGNAVLVEDSNELNISSSIFCWTRENGLVLRKVSWGTVAGNNVIDAGVRAPDGARRSGVVMADGTEGIQVTGNAVFSWGDQVPMEYGILEEADCRNNGIRGNNLNFFVAGGSVAMGSGSVAAENIVIGEPAYRGNPAKPCPDFDDTLIRDFLREQ